MSCKKGSTLGVDLMGVTEALSSGEVVLVIAGPADVGLSGAGFARRGAGGADSV